VRRLRVTSLRLQREDGANVFIFLEFDSVEDAQEARQRLLDSRVLERFQDRHGPNVVEEVESTRW
jgi:hypothetical protein